MRYKSVKRYLGAFAVMLLFALFVLSGQQKAGNPGPGIQTDTPLPTQFPADNFCEINVQAQSDKDKPLIKEFVDSVGGTVVKGFEENGLNMRVRVPQNAVDKFKESPSVERVEPYKSPVFLNDRASGLIGARPLQTPGFAMPGGLTGSGQIVAVADSGLDVGVNNDNMHPDFHSPKNGPSKIVGLTSVAGDLLPSDPVGHGTHVAGTILGTGAVSGGQYRGVAPEAGLYFQSILNVKDEPDPPANLSELFEPAYRAGARIHVNSWGTPENSYITTSSQIDAFMRSHPDFLVVFGAGNSGAGPNGTGTLAAEANSKNALVVGASENTRPGFGTDSDSYNDIAGFSSRGPAADGRIKPDLVAPGTAIVSTRSSLVPTNFPLNSRYTVMEGTSSAAALAAGAAALLREYLVSVNPGVTPTASLIKAALVNGAVRLGHSRTQEGFGLVDIQGTLLSLKENAMSYDDFKKGLGQGNTMEYIYVVEDAARPLKITMSWTDPAAAPGKTGKALVNDLDLTVTGPDGKTYCGNDFEGKGVPDRLNNTEQVFIEKPAKGSYVIKVNAVSERSGNSQDYAIVFGQPLNKGIITSVSESGRISLKNNLSINPVGANIHVSGDGFGLDGNPASFSLPAGSDIYYAADSKGKISDIYVSYSKTFLGSVKGYESDGQNKLVELRSDYSEGGLNLSRSPFVKLLVNKSPANSISEVLPGSDAIGLVNPGTGEIWRMEAEYTLKSGKITSVEPVMRKITLEDGQVYQLSRMVSISSDRGRSKTCYYDEPFTGTLNSLESIPAGCPVVMVISPYTREVGSLYADYGMVSGYVLKAPRGSLVFDNGEIYVLSSAETMVNKDGKDSDLSSIKAGDWAEGFIDAGSGDKLAAVNTYSQIVYGTVKEVKAEEGTLVVESNNNSSLFEVQKDVIPFINGKPGDLTGIIPGNFIRVAADAGGQALSINALEQMSTVITIGKVFKEEGHFNITSRETETYALAPYTGVLKEGLEMETEDLVADERAEIEYIVSPVTGQKIITRINSKAISGSSVPDIKLFLAPVKGTGNIEVIGRTTGNVVYAYLENNRRVVVPVEKDRSFKANIEVKTGGPQNITVVAVSRTSGRLSRAARTFYSLDNSMADTDIKGYWAEKFIRDALGMGIVRMYPDESFRPGMPATESMFADALSVAAGVSLDDPESGDSNSDPVTRLEGAVNLWKAAQAAGLNNTSRSIDLPPFKDWESIPLWGREAVLYCYYTGLLAGTPEGNFDPQRNLTRAEAAVLAYRLAMKIIEDM